MASDSLVFLNGEFVPAKSAKISVFDRGFLYGDGCFETMRAYDGVIFRLNDHLERLRNSLALLDIHFSYSSRQLSDICNRLIERNDLADAIVRLSVTRGLSRGGIGTSRAAEPSVVAFVRPPMPLPADAYTAGVSAKVVSIVRTPRRSLDARVKSMNLLNYILARSEAERGGAYEAVMLNCKGHVAEASAANIFFARNNSLFTPSADCDILLGITRAVVIELASQQGIPCGEVKMRKEEMNDFDECFLTNTGVELLPVTTIDSRSVGEGKPGATYTRLHQAYRERVRKG